jgi:hypothetical protein
MRIYSAQPTGKRHVIVSPGQPDTVLDAHNAHYRPAASERQPDWNRNAPIEKFSEQFLESMRQKGWLR